jgi:hypothetical protein
MSAIVNEMIPIPIGRAGGPAPQTPPIAGFAVVAKELGIVHRSGTREPVESQDLESITRSAWPGLLHLELVDRHPSRSIC